MPYSETCIDYIQGKIILKSGITSTLLVAFAVQACTPVIDQRKNATEVATEKSQAYVEAAPFIFVLALALAFASGGRSGGAGSCSSSSVTPYVC
jgi:hypothetical protein